jgi:hypothetical protein
LALCTQVEVERKLQWDITADPDSTVTQHIEDAQALIEAEIGRTVESAARTETLDGGRVTYFLKWWPITEITSVTEDGTALVEDDDFKWYEGGKLIRVSTSGYQILWRTRKRQSIDVVYVGGYLAGHSAEHDMALEHLGSICAEVVARAFRKGADSAALPAGVSGQVQSVSLTGSDTVTYATAGGAGTFQGGLTRFIYLEEDELRQLQKYRRLHLGFA